MAQKFRDSAVQAWAKTFDDVLDIFKEIVKQILRTKHERWSLTDEQREKYAFLIRPEFINSYVECISIHIEEFNLGFLVDSDLLEQKGFPRDLPILLEYGDFDFAPLPHWSESIERFRQEHEERLLQKFGNATVEACST